MNRGDDPRESYSYRLVVRDIQKIGYDRDPTGHPEQPDHGHRYSGDGTMLGRFAATRTFKAFLDEAEALIGAHPGGAPVFPKPTGK